jgi:hypothetical protein
MRLQPLNLVTVRVIPLQSRYFLTPIPIGNRWPEGWDFGFVDPTNTGGTVFYPSCQAMAEFVPGGYTTQIHSFIGDDSGVFIDTNEKSFLSFQALAASSFRDGYALNFFSSRNAINHLFESVRGNYLETFLEIKELFGIMPAGNLLKALKQAYLAKKLDFLGLLNQVADAQLVYAFGLAPTVSDSFDLSSKAQRILQRMVDKEFLVFHAGRGLSSLTLESSVKLPIAQIFSGTKVEARSKVVARIHPDSLLAAVLPLKSFGVLPTLSAIWDLIPWSFLIDWATDNGSRLDAVDTSAIFLSLDIAYCVHSLTFIYEFNEDDQYLNNFTVPQGSSAGYKLYERFSTREPPILTPTRLPVFNEPGIPNFGTAGALAWQNLRG